MNSTTKFVCVFLVAMGVGCGAGKTPNQGSNVGPAENRPDNPTLTISVLKNNKMQFTHAGPMGTDVVDGEVGFTGHATSVEGPHYNVVVKLAWPSPKVCEMTIDYDSKRSSRMMTVNLTGLTDAKATSDGKATTLPAILPSGKHKLVINANCP